MLRKYKNKDEMKALYNEVIRPIAIALEIPAYRFVRIAGVVCTSEPTFDEARLSDYEFSATIDPKTRAVCFSGQKPLQFPYWLLPRIWEVKGELNPKGFFKVEGTETGRFTQYSATSAVADVLNMSGDFPDPDVEIYEVTNIPNMPQLRYKAQEGKYVVIPTKLLRGIIADEKADGKNMQELRELLREVFGWGDEKGC